MSNIFSRTTPTVDNDLSHQNQVVKTEMLWTSHVAEKTPYVST